MTGDQYDELVAHAVGATVRARAAETWGQRAAVALWALLLALSAWAAARALWTLAGAAPPVATALTAAACAAVGIYVVRATRVAAAWLSDLAVGLSASEREAIDANTAVLAWCFGLEPTADPELDDFTGTGVHCYDTARKVTLVTLDLSEGQARLRYLPHRTRRVSLA